MRHNGPFHHAFRTNYAGIVRELITDCKISLPSATDPSPTKQVFPFKAVWDTGASHSVIAQKVAQQVSLVPTGKAETHGVHGSKSNVNTYIVDIVLPNNVCITNITVSEGCLIGAIDVLIGMDIIQLGDFSISNAGGKTCFSYCLPPHKNPIDLLEKSNCVNARIR